MENIIEIEKFRALTSTLFFSSRFIVVHDDNNLAVFITMSLINVCGLPYKRDERE